MEAHSPVEEESENETSKLTGKLNRNTKPSNDHFQPNTPPKSPTAHPLLLFNGCDDLLQSSNPYNYYTPPTT